MSYGTLANVKQRLNLDDTEDSRVTRAITQADALIDQELKPYTTVPLSPAPQTIKDIADDWAAGIVHHEVTNPTSQNPPPNVFTQRAKEMLCRYLAVNYSAPCPFEKQVTTGGGGGTQPPVIAGPDPVLYEQPVDN
jgi:hypothetical protein